MLRIIFLMRKREKFFKNVGAKGEYLRRANEKKAEIL